MIWRWILIGLVPCLFAGCFGDTGVRDMGGSYDPRFLASEEPNDPLDVQQVRSTSKNDDVVVVVGRVGGSAKPFVDGLGVFTIVDLKIPTCSSDPNCSVDCSVSPEELKQSLATIKLIDDSGTLVGKDSRELVPVLVNSIVVVQGRASVDTHGNLTILAQNLAIRNQK